MKTTIELARESGRHLSVNDITGALYAETLKAFEALVRADEREACAKVCEEAFSSSHVGRVVCNNLAADIRARGKT